MKPPLEVPTEASVSEACARFDSENKLVEEALGELFRQYAKNADPRHVLLKVVAVNSLYYTQIFAVQAVAEHIHKLAIDVALDTSDPEIVDQISKITINEKTRHNYSFATKYCSWHRPHAYPIWDSRVDSYLRRLQKEAEFSKGFKSEDLWRYRSFRDVVSEFRDFYHLRRFSFKEIDKFLWFAGGNSSTDDARSPIQQA